MSDIDVNTDDMKVAEVIAALWEQISKLKEQRDYLDKQLTAVASERDSWHERFVESEKLRIQTKAEWDSKQAEIRKERQLRGRAEEEMRAMERDRDWWKRQYENAQIEAAKDDHYSWKQKYEELGASRDRLLKDNEDLRHHLRTIRDSVARHAKDV